MERGSSAVIQNLEKVRLTVWEKQYFTPVLTCSNLFKPFHTCSHMLTAVHTCSHLFTPRWISMIFAQWQFLVEFCPCESCYFLNLCATLLKLHIFAHQTIQRCLAWVYVRNKNVDPSGSLYYSDHVHLSRNVIFCTFECSYSSVLRCILLKLHILTRLIESFPTLYGL